MLNPSRDKNARHVLSWGGGRKHLLILLFVTPDLCVRLPPLTGGREKRGARIINGMKKKVTCIYLCHHAHVYRALRCNVGTQMFPCPVLCNHGTDTTFGRKERTAGGGNSATPSGLFYVSVHSSDHSSVYLYVDRAAAPVRRLGALLSHYRTVQNILFIMVYRQLILV